MFLHYDDYDLFIFRVHKYILPVAEIYAYSLIPNHYHMMVKIKSYEALLAYAKSQTLSFQEKDMWINKMILKQLSDFQNSYCKKINFKYKRKGSLFIKRIRRVSVESDKQFISTVFYIHKNPVHHSISKDIRDWPFSSYHQYLDDGNLLINPEPVLQNFGGKEHFLQFHNQKIYPKESIQIENE